MENTFSSNPSLSTITLLTTTPLPSTDTSSSPLSTLQTSATLSKTKEEFNQPTSTSLSFTSAPSSSSSSPSLVTNASISVMTCTLPSSSLPNPTSSTTALAPVLSSTSISRSSNSSTVQVNLSSSPLLFKDQVAGHQLIIQVNERMIGKPFTPIEYQFYLDAQSSFPSLLPYLPQLHPCDPTYPNYLLLENLLVDVPNACILDLKLGTQLHRDDASERKKAKMQYRAKTTTNGSLGVRVSGMRISMPMSTSLFPSSSASSSSSSPSSLSLEDGIPKQNEPGCSVQWFNREYGWTLTKETFHECFLALTQSAPFPLKTLKELKFKVEQFANVVQILPGKFIGTSFLILVCPTSGQVKLHWIDFVRSEFHSSPAPDTQFMTGVYSVLKCLDEAMHVLKTKNSTLEPSRPLPLPHHSDGTTTNNSSFSSGSGSSHSSSIPLSSPNTTSNPIKKLELNNGAIEEDVKTEK